MSERKQPTGGKEFDELASKLARVPKKELDTQLKKERKAKQRRKKN